jgi:hypothetical protein
METQLADIALPPAKHGKTKTEKNKSTPNGIALMSQIQQAFIVKSRGGVGSDGIQWPPLKRSTIAQRPIGVGERKQFKIGGKRTRGLLTKKQDEEWKKIFGSRLARFRLFMSEGEAKARAAQIAWAILKSKGAKTKIGVLGGRVVDILRDTGELLRSLTPGIEDQPSHAEGQIFRLSGNSVTVGSNKKPWHHRGTKRIPARPLWPLDGSLPPAWRAAVVIALQSAIQRALVALLKQGYRP